MEQERSKETEEEYFLVKVKEKRRNLERLRDKHENVTPSPFTMSKTAAL